MPPNPPSPKYPPYNPSFSKCFVVPYECTTRPPGIKWFFQSHPKFNSRKISHTLCSLWGLSSFDKYSGPVMCLGALDFKKARKITCPRVWGISEIHDFTYQAASCLDLLRHASSTALADFLGALATFWYLQVSCTSHTSSLVHSWISIFPQNRHLPPPISGATFFKIFNFILFQ